MNEICTLLKQTRQYEYKQEEKRKVFTNWKAKDEQEYPLRVFFLKDFV